MGTLFVSIFQASGDGKYYGRYPEGNAPLGAALASSATASTTGSGTLMSSGTPPAAPTNLQLILQGATKQGANENGNTGSYTPTAPNSQTVGWNYDLSTPDLTEFKFYRSVTTVPGVNGAYEYLGTVTASAAASNYSSYVSNSTFSTGTAGFETFLAPGINCAWTDSAATGCANGSYGPNSGYYYGITVGYSYYVTAVVGGVESAASPLSIIPFFVNGIGVFCEGIFNNGGQCTFGSTNPGGTLSPLGFTKSVYVTLPTYPGNHYINPFTGASCCQYNLSVCAYNYLNLGIYPTAYTSGDLSDGFEIADDLDMGGSGAFPTEPTIGQWNTIKLPLSTFMTPDNSDGGTVAPAANGIRQVSHYKGTISNDGSDDPKFYLEMWFSVD